MQYVTKLCADSLRSFTLENYGIKLKAAHAHELVAMFLGYKSKNAMLADTIRPLENLKKAEFIVFDPSPQNSGYIDQKLKDFGYQCLHAFHLTDCFYSTLRNEKLIKSKIQVSLREVAIQIGEQCLNQRLNALIIGSNSMEWDIDGDMLYWTDKGEALLEARVGYETSTGERYRYSKYKIHLRRIAANLGYGDPQIEETTYSGDAAKYSDEELLKRYPIPAVMA